MTFEVLLYFIHNLRLHNVSIHRNVYQNWFINEYARKKKEKEKPVASFRAPNNKHPSYFYMIFFAKKACLAKCLNHPCLNTYIKNFFVNVKAKENIFDRQA